MPALHLYIRNRMRGIKMLRQIIHIDEELCNGCGLCASACHEGAIEIIDGKAKLVREHFCDGLGDCLPSCPTNAISFEHRDAPAYDEAAVMESKKKKLTNDSNRINVGQSSGCPGSRMRTFNRDVNLEANKLVLKNDLHPSRLNQWPCQIKLVPEMAPFFDDAHLLIAADCTAYAYANMHEDFMKGKVTIIACPKLDDIDYSTKLTSIIANNSVKSVTIVRMEVPCCGGLQAAAITALKNSGKFIPWQVVTISCDGRIIE